MLRAASTTFIEPCLPSPADKPPSGSNCFHEIKHDGFRLMARRDPVGIRLITRRGNDGTNRYPLVAEAVNYLKVQFCLIDGEVVATRREWLPFSCSSDRIARGRFCQALRPYVLKLVVGQALQAHEGVVCLAHADELVELHLDRGTVSVRCKGSSEYKDWKGPGTSLNRGLPRPVGWSQGRLITLSNRNAAG